MALLSPYPKLQFFDDSGDPLNGGLLYAYSAGTSTPKDTYTTAAGTVANANPVVLDSAGRATVFLGTGNYKLVLKTSAGVEVWTQDNVSGTDVSYTTVDSVAELKALASGQSDYVYVGGYYAAGDGGGGWFYWDSTSTTTNDDGVVIQPSAAPSQGRWKRSLDGFVDVKMYGAKGDGTTDDTDAFTDADSYANTNSVKLVFSDGEYMITADHEIEADYEFMPGAKINIASTKTLTMSGKINCDPLHQIFSGAGAVTIAAGAVTHVRPEWFGGFGDDSTDCRAAIEAAANALVGGGKVKFSSGTYRIDFLDDAAHRITHTNTSYFPWQTGNLVAIKVTNDNVSFEGSGKYTSIIKIADITVPSSPSGLYWMLGVYKTSNFCITDLTLDGNRDSTTVAAHGIFCCGNEDYTGGRETGFLASNVMYKNVSIDNIFLNIDDVSVDNCSFDYVNIGCDVHFVSGFSMCNNDFDSYIEGCDLDKKVYNFTVSNNTFRNRRSGGDATIELNGSRHGTVIGNSIDAGGYADGILIAGKRAFGDQTVANEDTQTDDVAVVGNTIHNCSRGIYIPNYLTGGDPGYEYDAKNVVIASNTVYDCDGTDNAGWGITITGHNIVCTGNLVYDCDSGITTHEASPFTDGIIANNIVRDVGYNGIWVRGNNTTAQLENIKVTSNLVNGYGSVDTTDGCGILVVEPNHVTISDNVVRGTTSRYGIRVNENGASWSDAVVSGNKSEGGTDGYKLAIAVWNAIKFEYNDGTIEDDYVRGFDIDAATKKIVLKNGYINAIGAAAYFDIHTNTSDTADTKIIRIGGGGDLITTRGAFVALYGNEADTYGGQARYNTQTASPHVFSGGQVQVANTSEATSETNASIGTAGGVCVAKTVMSKAGAAAAAVSIRLGATSTEGYEIRVIDETVEFTATASQDLTEDIPANAVILCVQANNETAITGASGATGVSIGILATSDKYGSMTLNKNDKIDTIPDYAVLAGGEDVQIYNVGGGTIAGTVRVRIVYAVCNSLDDAA